MQGNVKPKDTALIELGKDMEQHNADVHRLQWETSEQDKRGYETVIDRLCKTLSEIKKQTAKTL